MSALILKSELVFQWIILSRHEFFPSKKKWTNESSAPPSSTIIFLNLCIHHPWLMIKQCCHIARRSIINTQVARYLLSTSITTFKYSFLVILNILLKTSAPQWTHTRTVYTSTKTSKEQIQLWRPKWPLSRYCCRCCRQYSVSRDLEMMEAALVPSENRPCFMLSVFAPIPLHSIFFWRVTSCRSSF